MGKQINFYMDTSTELELAKLVLEEGGQILYRDETGQPWPVTALPEPFSGRWWSLLYLYRPEFGPLTLKRLVNGAIFLDTDRSPVIEFDRSVVSPDDKKVSRGRLWVEMRYWDDKENLILKPPELAKWYETLRRWIIRNLPVKYGDSSFRKYASESIGDLVLQGYELL